MLAHTIPTNSLEIGNKTDDEKIDGPIVDEETEHTWTKDKVMQDFRRFNIDLTPKVKTMIQKRNIPSPLPKISEIFKENIEFD